MGQWARLCGLWLVIFAAVLWVGMVATHVAQARAAAHPPPTAVALAARVSAAIDARPAAVGHWTRVQPSWQEDLVAWFDTPAVWGARLYLGVLGEKEAVAWVGQLDRARGAAMAVLVYARGQGIPVPRAPGAGVSDAVFCLPAQTQGRWIALFWDGPWAEDRFASAQGLMGVCERHAPLALKGLMMAGL